MLGQFLAFFKGDLALVLHIGLVADKDAGDVVRGVLLDLAHPGFDGREGLTVSNIISNDDTVRSLVVRGGDRLESLLASGVPDLQLDGLAFYFDGPDFL